jgi:hypothetical protein
MNKFVDGTDAIDDAREALSAFLQLISNAGEKIEDVNTHGFCLLLSSIHQKLEAGQELHAQYWAETCEMKSAEEQRLIESQEAEERAVLAKMEPAYSRCLARLSGLEMEKAA